MSITRAEITEIILNMKSGGQVSSNYKIDPSHVIKVVDMALAYLISKHYFISKEAGEDIDGSFITAFPNNIVYFDNTRKEYFILLPARIIKLPGGNDKGLRQISGPASQDNVFIKNPNNSSGTMSGLESSGLLGKIGYYLEGSKVFFVDRNRSIDGNTNGKIKAVSNVMVKMVASVDGYDDDEPLPVPADMEMELLTLCKSMFDEEKMTPVDNSNDGSSK